VREGDISRLIRVDCHLHTVHSGDSVLRVAELAERVAAERLDVVCVTDHHTLAGAYEALEQDIGARVIVGEEIRTGGGEIIGLFMSERVPYVLPLAEAVRRIRDQGGLVYAPHPLDPGRSSLGRARLTELCANGVADVVEVFNSKVRDQAWNTEAAEIATRYGVPGAAGSDAHDAHGIGAAYVEMPDFDGPSSFLASLTEGTITGEFRDHAGWQFTR
jgi:predicted metal-dependent phosphoesterase TrpH